MYNDNFHELSIHSLIISSSSYLTGPYFVFQPYLFLPIEFVSKK